MTALLMAMVRRRGRGAYESRSMPTPDQWIGVYQTSSPWAVRLTAKSAS